MAENTKIEWADHTFNPWEGCTKVSPGCANCYAENRNARFGGGTAPNWGKGKPRRRTSAANWNKVRKWNREAEEIEHAYNVEIGGHFTEADEMLEAPHRPRVFCASLADWLDDEVPIEWLADLLDLIRECSSLDFLLLTKRPELWEARLSEVCYIDGDSIAWSWLRNIAPANVWVGTSVEDQKRADERIPKLLSIPAEVRFLSCEPLLGEVNVEWVFDPTGYLSCGGFPECECDGCKSLARFPRDEYGSYAKIHWVICGGESGSNARPMKPDWARSLRDQCEAAGVPFLFKQWGCWRPAEAGEMHWQSARIELFFESEKCGYYCDPGRDFHPHGGQYMRYFTKARSAGRLLDGVEHTEFPEAYGD